MTAQRTFTELYPAVTDAIADLDFAPANTETIFGWCNGGMPSRLNVHEHEIVAGGMRLISMIIPIKDYADTLAEAVSMIRKNKKFEPEYLLITDVLPADASVPATPSERMSQRLASLTMVTSKLLSRYLDSEERTRQEYQVLETGQLSTGQYFGDYGLALRLDINKESESWKAIQARHNLVGLDQLRKFPGYPQDEDEIRAYVEWYGGDIDEPMNDNARREASKVIYDALDYPEQRRINIDGVTYVHCDPEGFARLFGRLFGVSV